MNTKFRSYLSLAFLLVISSAAFANGSQDRTQFGHNIEIGPDEQVGDATCFGCTIRVHGHVASDVTVFGGNIYVEDQGEVDGDVTSFAGNIHLDRETKVGGDVTVFGGRVYRDPSVSIGGDVTNMGGGGWILLIFILPLIVLGALLAFVIWLIRRLLRPSVPASA
jgi:hypothetical protein